MGSNGALPAGQAIATPFFKTEWPLPISVATAVVFLVFGAQWLDPSSGAVMLGLLSLGLFAVITLSSFAVVRHAEHIADKVGEPLGTLVLTLAVTGIEVMIIAAVMYTGQGNVTMARDAMFAVVMIVLNGMVGVSLILGGLRHHEQTYNLQGANAFLAVIVPLAVLGLVLPNFTLSSAAATFSSLQATFLIFMSLALYGVFLTIQNLRHREYFVAPGANPGSVEDNTHGMHGVSHRSIAFHAVLLLCYLLPLVVLSKQLAVPINYAIDVLHAPAALGGLAVAIIVLSPESMSAVRAALNNQLQRSVNILLGSVLATISLTIPAVLTIGFLTGQSVVLGLDAVDRTLLILTLGISMLTFASARTNVLLGAVHVLLFLAYLLLIFDR